jgi:hypothetical protein
MTGSWVDDEVGDAKQLVLESAPRRADHRPFDWKCHRLGRRDCLAQRNRSLFSSGI